MILSLFINTLKFGRVDNNIQCSELTKYFVDEGHTEFGSPIYFLDWFSQNYETTIIQIIHNIEYIIKKNETKTWILYINIYFFCSSIYLLSVYLSSTNYSLQLILI